MSNYTAYALILIGVLILAFNYGYLNLSMLTLPLALPVIFIIAGVVDILTRILPIGDLGRVLRTIMTIILIVAIILNVSTLTTKFFLDQVRFMPHMHNEGPEFFANNSYYSCSFCNLSGYIYNNMMYVMHDGELYQSNSSSNTYSLTNAFTNAVYDFSGSATADGSIVVENVFGDSSVSNLEGFKHINIKNVFGMLNLHTGQTTGEVNLRVESVFGTVNIYVDQNAAHNIDSNAVFGATNNYVGLRSDNYDSSENKISVSSEAVFGTVNIYNE